LFRLIQSIPSKKAEPFKLWLAKVGIERLDEIENPELAFERAIEHQFALATENDDEVICFLKLPAYYKIKTPIGDYNPDFGVVMKRKSLRDGKESEFYFAIETKGTNDINNKKALKESEVYKIKCAMKHFATLGAEVQYKGPVKEYQYFKTNV
jgi:type III restriction enzyme